MLAEQSISFWEAIKLSAVGMLIVMLELAALAVFVYLLSFIIRLFEKRKSKTASPAPILSSQPPAVGVPLPQANTDKVELIDTDEATAAVIMAIVSDKSGIPLNRLKFERIKKVED
ncbi:MAG: OadG family protein [Acutalibacteraceae bacterium]|jgi:Na+-transporting methylmalonyl-CoA/oxaloacetate decarboxylase gamma subunit